LLHASADEGVLQSEGLVSISGYVGFTFQVTPTVIIPKPKQIAILIGHLSRDADLVAVEVVGLLVAFSVFVCPIVYLCQGFVAVGVGVDIGIPVVPNFSVFQTTLMFRWTLTLPAA